MIMMMMMIKFVIALKVTSLDTAVERETESHVRSDALESLIRAKFSVVLAL